MSLPIKFQELLQLSNVNIHQSSITFNACTLESDHFICVRQKVDDNASPEVIIVELRNGNNVIRRPIKADSAIMHWTRQIIALKAQSRTLQVFDLEARNKLKSTTMSEDVLFWKWINEKSLGLVTETSVYHWDVFSPTEANPTKMFDRHQSLAVSLASFLTSVTHR